MNSSRQAIIFGLVLIVFFFGTIVHSQSPSPSKDTVKTIFDYKQELNLTDQQEQNIKIILQDLSTEVRVTRAKLTLIDVDATELIKKNGDAEQIRKKLKDAAEIQVDLKMADILATRKINKVLSEAQLKKWRALQAAAGQQQTK